jgi:hypothetical protein
VPNLKLRHKHRAAHPNTDPSSVPSLPLSLHTLSVQMHTRFKLKIGIEIEPEPMELPECKAGSAIGKCKTGSRKKERKKSSEMCGQMCAGNLKLGSVSFQSGEENRNCVFSGTDANLIKPGAGLAGQKPVRNS